MPKYVAVGLDGRKYSFNISGASPTEDEMRRIEARLYGTPTVAPKDAESTWGDYLQSGKAGVGDIAQGLGWLSGSEGVEQWGKDIANEATLATSPGGRQIQAEGVFGGGGFDAALHGVLRSAPQMVAGLAATAAAIPSGGTSVGAAGAMILSKAPWLARMAAPMAARLGVSVEQFVGQTAMGSLAGSAVEGTLGGGLGGSQAEEAVLQFAKANPAEFSQSEIGSKYLAQYGGDMELAAQAAAREIANNAALKTGLTTGAVALPGGMIEAGLLKGALGGGLRGAARGAFQSAAQEAPEEFAQSFTEQMYANQAMQRAGSMVGTLDNAFRSGIEGAAVGALAGGAFGGAAGVFGSRLDPVAARQRDLQDFINSNAVQQPKSVPIQNDSVGDIGGDQQPLQARYNQGSITGDFGAVGEPPPYQAPYTLDTNPEYTGATFNEPQYNLGRSGFDGLPVNRAQQERGVLAGRDGSTAYTVDSNLLNQAASVAGSIPGSQNPSMEGSGNLSTNYSGQLDRSQGLPVYGRSSEPAIPTGSAIRFQQTNPQPGKLDERINYRNYQQLDARSAGVEQPAWQARYVDKLEPDDPLANLPGRTEGVGPGAPSITPQPIQYGRPATVPGQGTVSGVLSNAGNQLDLTKPPPSSFADSTSTYSMGGGGTTQVSGRASEPLRTIYVDKKDASTLAGVPFISDNLNGTATAVNEKGQGLPESNPLSYSETPAVGLVPVRIKPVTEINGYQVFAPELGSEIQWVGAPSVQEAYTANEGTSTPESQPAAPSSQERRTKFATELRKSLKKIGLKDVQIKLVDDIENGALGSYDVEGTERIITLAMSPVMGKSDAEISQHLSAVMNHELMHDLFAGGLFTKGEVKRLYQYVRTQTYQNSDGSRRKFTWHEWAQSLYGDKLDVGGVYEEAIAEAFKAWAANHSGQPGLPSTLFNRIIQFFKSMWSGLTRAIPDTVFKDIQSGEVANSKQWTAPKPEDKKTPGPKYSLPNLYNTGQRVPPPSVNAQQRYLDVSYAAAYDELFNAVNKGYRAAKTVANYVGIGQNLPAQLNMEPAYNLFRKFQSRSLPLARFIDAINQAGVQVDDAVNPYLQQQLMKARIEQDQISGQKNVIDPAEEKLRELPIQRGDLAELIAHARLNIDPELADEMERSLVDENEAIQKVNMFGLYLNARHAPERNQYMREHWTELNEDGEYVSTFNEQENGAGLTDSEAAQVLSWFESKYETQRLRDIAQSWYDVIADSRRIAQIGKLTPDWSQHPDALAWRYYVPLVGRADIDSSMTGTIDPKLSVSGRENRRAFGRASLANQIIPEIIRRHRVTIDRANHNALMNDLIDMVEQNPSLWTDFGQVVWQQPQRPGMKSNRKFGYVKTPVESDPLIVTAKNVRANPAGVEESYLRMLKLAEPWQQLADYLNGRDIKLPGDEYAIVRGGMAVNRMLGGMLTRFNPEFPLSNWPRDIMGAMVNLQQYEGVQPLAVLKNAAYSLKSIYRHERDSTYTDEFTPYIDAVKQAGGLTSGYGFDNIETIRDNIIKMSATPGKFKQTMTQVKDWMEHANSAFENSVRVSTYKAMLDAGYSPTAAAYAAKTVTVNFDEGGTLRNWMNAAYLFFNASLQGTFGIATAAARSAKVRKWLGGIAASAFAMDVLNYAMSPEDDEGRNLYDSIPEYVKSRNIVLMIPGSRGYIKLPMPYGYMFFANAGRSVAGVTRGISGFGKGMTVGEATASTMQSLVDNFNPLGGSNSWLNFVAPTVLDPWIDLARNRNFADANIYPEERGYGPGTPTSQLYWNNTSSVYTLAAELLRIPGTGTDKLEGAGLEWSPNQIQYMVDWALGGVGQLASRTMNLGEKIVTGSFDELEVGDIPGIRKWTGFAGGRATKQAFYDLQDKYLKYEQEIKDARADGEPDRIRVIRENEPALWANMGRFKALNSRRTKVLRAARKLESNERIPEEQKRDKIKRLREAANQIAEQILALEAQ